MTLKEYLLLEEYQDLYCFKSNGNAEIILNNGFIHNSVKEDSEKNNYICVTRNKNYRRHNENESINIGSLRNLPGSFDVAFVLDSEKIKQHYKIRPAKNKYLNDPEYAKRVSHALTRYEAEERIEASKLPLKYVKKIIVKKNGRLEYFKKLAKKYNIPVEFGEI